MPRIIRKFSVAVALLLGMTVCMASPASAQTKRFNVFGGYSYGTNNFGNELVGIALPQGAALNGYGAAFTVNLNNHIGLEASFTGHNGTATQLYEAPTATQSGQLVTADEGLYTYTFGPRLFQTVGDFSIFTHFLVGGVHLNETSKNTCLPPTGGGSCTPLPLPTIAPSGSGFAFKTGAGVDWNHGRWGVRILEVDYVHGQMLGAISTFLLGQPTSLPTSANNFELTTGITFNFGSSL